MYDMFKTIMANVFGITGRVWGQVAAGKTCVGWSHELLCGVYSWVQLALKPTWASHHTGSETCVGNLLHTTAGEHPAPLLGHIRKSSWCEGQEEQRRKMCSTKTELRLWGTSAMDDPCQGRDTPEGLWPVSDPRWGRGQWVRSEEQ